MTGIEAYEDHISPEIADRVRALLAEATDIEDVALIRDQAEAMRVLARRRDMGIEMEMAAGEAVRRAERKLAEMVIAARDAGIIRKAGRPKSGSADQEYAFNVKDVFSSDPERKYAIEWAKVDDDSFEDALAAARERGDLSRRALARALSPERAPRNGEAVVNIERVMARALKALSLVVASLETFDPATIEHEDRKYWGTALRDKCAAIDTWRKGLPR